LVNLYFFGKVTKRNVNFGDKEERRNKKFFSNMYDGMSFFLNFLKNPVEYCNNYKCTVYNMCDNDNKNNIYHIIHNIDNKRYMLLIVNFTQDISSYLVTYHKEIRDDIKERQIVQLGTIKEILIGEKQFFENELKEINDLINEHKKLVDDVMRELLPS
jgi:hypothetical protein